MPVIDGDPRLKGREDERARRKGPNDGKRERKEKEVHGASVG